MSKKVITSIKSKKLNQFITIKADKLITRQKQLKEDVVDYSDFSYPELDTDVFMMKVREISQAKLCAGVPNSAQALAVISSFSTLRPTKPQVTPWVASIFEIALPIPPLPPTTSAFLPSSSKINLFTPLKTSASPANKA